jgi:hypothetical protein
LNIPEWTDTLRRRDRHGEAREYGAQLIRLRAPVVADPVADVGTRSRMQIEFRAYADDYIVRGDVVLEGARLADMLNNEDALSIERVTIRALEDGREHDLASAVITREELCVVVATGPRGSVDRRVRTRAYPFSAQVGPYAVVGYLQALPTADPRVTARRREIVALSSARITFTVAGERIEESHDALLLVGAKMTLFEPASDKELGLARELEVVRQVDSQAKDLTGEVRSPKGE